MSDKTTSDPTAATNNAQLDTEPGITQRNSATVKGEEQLESGGSVETNMDDATSTRTKLGAIPSGYGTPGGTTSEGVDADAGADI